MIRQVVSACLLVCVWVPFAIAREKSVRTIVLIAGKKSHGPGEHEYEKSVKLLKVMLDRSPNLHGIKTETYFNGWPDDPKVLDTASTIVFISDGMEWLPFGTDERIAALQKQMDRGCGFVTFHFSTYIPFKYEKQALEWNGGFVQYDGPGGFDDPKTIEADMTLPSPKHPVSKGVHAYHYKDEFYYKIHFRPDDSAVIPIVRVPALQGSPQEQTVAWAVQRKDGGHSVGITYGHYYENWRNENYRKLILNAIVWTAGVKVPRNGVQSKFVEDGVVEKAIGSAGQ
jgi:type 1 glutamine amidotransferase